MKFKKDGVIIDNNNPVFDNLYLKQGWIPVVGEPIPGTVEETTEPDANSETTNGDISSEVSPNADSDTPAVEIPKVYTKEKLNAMSRDRIIALAAKLGYTITADKRADIIEEFLKIQSER